MVGEYYILLYANTPLARLTPGSLRSHTRFARTLASAPPRLLPRRRLLFATLTPLAHSLRSHTRSAPLSARFLWSHAGTLARLTPRSLFLAHSCSHTRFARTLAPRSRWSHGLLNGVASLRFKTHKDLSYHSY